jgi:hypothetical protein
VSVLGPCRLTACCENTPKVDQSTSWDVAAFVAKACGRSSAGCHTVTIDPLDRSAA